MYVCVCNGYRDSEISEVARRGVRCARRAYLEMGNGPRCGQCLEMAQDIIDDVHAAESSERFSYPVANDRSPAAKVFPAGRSEAPVARKSRVSFPEV